MSAFRIFAAAVSLSAVAACQQVLGPAIPGDRAAAPAEQSLAAQCAADATIIAQLDSAVNAARQAEGKTLLDSAPLLAQAAQSHACDMARTGRIDVEGSNGSNVVDRARAVGYPACGVVQLVSRGGSPAQAVTGWLGAEAQRTELLGQTSRQIGSGFARGTDGLTYYSVVLGDNCA